MSSPSTQYIILREDLPPGDQLAQTAHAAAGSMVYPVPEDAFVVVLGCPSEGALRHIAKRLSEAGIVHKLIVEPDLGNQATAIGCAPVTDRSAVRRITSSLPLAGRRATNTCSPARELAEALAYKEAVLKALPSVDEEAERAVAQLLRERAQPSRKVALKKRSDR